ncbi:MAG: FliA/WhiG family RNA polymerase sigma factor [Myxococcota bacterium]|nr:FliA/WhiG family RNA polymerase sigma factor [Myxococcota bacterium]
METNNMRDGDQDRDQLIELHFHLVARIVRGVAARLPAHVDRDDLTSAGMIGLLDAAEKFDSAFGSSFKGYAEIRIRGAIIDELRQQDWLPRAVRQETRRLGKAEERLSQRLGRAPRESELAEELSLDQGALRTLQQQRATDRVISYEDLSRREDGSTPILERFADQSVHLPDEALQLAEYRQTLLDSLAALPVRDRVLFALREFEELRLHEISALLGISEARISQLCQRIRKKLIETIQESD